MVLNVGYKLAIGKWAINSADDPRTELAEIETISSMDSPGDYCRISVYAPPAPQPGLLEQAIGEAASALGFGEEEEEAFSIQVRGQAIKTGDPITIELSSRDNSAKVMTAELHSIRSSFGLTQIIGRTGAQKLADARLNQVYENQSLKQIVSDLASQSQAGAGQIEQGSSYSYFVADQSKNLLRQIRELAAREGMDAYFDADNKLTLKKFNKSSADHTFYFGIDIFDLQIFNRPASSDHLLVYGESPASNQGSDTWHWIAKDLTPFRSEAGQGVKTLGIHDGAVRTKDAADNLATSKFGAIKDHAAGGRMKILGNPKVKLGDAIEIKNASKPELNGLFKITSVRHVFNKREGYLTFIHFTGSGGAEKASSLLGGLAGALGI